MRGPFRSSLLLAGVLLALGCDKPLVDWNDPEPVAWPATNDAGGAPRLIVDTTGAAGFAAASAAPRLSPPMAGDDCRRSLQSAVATVHAYAAWWHVRSDSSAALYVARSADGGRSWDGRIVIDSSDVSSNGCDRPAPSLTTVGDDVYVAYSMIAPEGKGVFFAHVMGGMLHAPVAVIYGERLVHTAIAAQDPRVVVAYEDPNGSRQQIGVALSTTQGHLFDWRTTASRSIDHAVLPQVALAGRVLAVSWSPAQSGDGTRRMVRVGRLQ